jgi:hypothetical protein
MSEKTIIIPQWFKIVAFIAFVWNLLGVMAFVMQMMMTPEVIEKLPEAEQALYNNMPLWVTIAFACAVFGGALGSLFLILKKALATALFTVSLLGVLAQMFHSFFISNTFEVYGPGAMIMPLMVLIIAFVLLWLSLKAKNNQWLT